VVKRFLAIGLVILGASAVSIQMNELRAHAQANCTLTMAQAPVISGIKLGMTPEQVLALFPGSREDKEVSDSLAKPPSKFGVSGFMIRPERYASKSKFSGVSQITFTLLDGRVSTLNIGYNGTEWKHVDEFVTKFSEGKNLPAAATWEAQVGMDTQLKILKCKEFEVSVFAGGKNVKNMNYVQLRDIAATQKLKERREKAKEMERLKQAIPGASLLP
jgi:hypothetical protein